MNNVSFADIAIVSCGTLSLELNHLKKEGFMDMIAGETERDLIAKEIAEDEKVWWMTPGWIQFRHKVFKGWV